MDKTVAQRLAEIQREQREWSLRNFGVQQAHRMALGLIEELGEVAEAWMLDSKEKLFDSIGDVGIYMLNYCNIAGWELPSLYEMRQPRDKNAERMPHFVTPLMRAIAHHQLKGEQNIRGGAEHHARMMEGLFRNILFQMEALSAHAVKGGTFLSILEATWQKVSKRDWVQNPNNADVVAENG
jgi:NTP pyrophosphatase (non-canonical NTP hydrolase)